MTGTFTDKDGTVSPLEILQTGPSLDDKIKAKAQEVRLALLGRLHGTIEFIAAKEDELRLLSEAASILNQLDPGAHGIGSYGTLLASAEEIAPPGA